MTTKAIREPSRIREQGTIVTNPTQEADHGTARINAFRQIVERGQYAKIDGMMVDLFSASAVVKVYDALNETNQAKYRTVNAAKMASIAFQLIK
jgi:hypothetical protein